MNTAKRRLIILILLSVIIICALAGILTACKGGNGSSDDEPSYVAVTSVSLNESSVTLVEGKTFNLIARIWPNGATNKQVTFAVTAGSEYASVNEEGTVTALLAGNAVVTVTTQDGNFTDTCNVKVLPHATAITLDKTSLVLNVDKENNTNQSYKLKATVMPEGAVDDVLFFSENPEIATVEQDGTVTAIKTGETVIKAYIGTDVTAECAVRVGYTVTVQTDGGGEAWCDKDYYTIAEKCQLGATPAPGNMFIGWYLGDELLSLDKNYKEYEVKGDVVLTSKFAPDTTTPQKNSDGYYELASNADLVWASQYSDENFILISDITASTFAGFNVFNGIFDGNHHTVSSLSAQGGFFNELHGTVKNLNLTGVDCTGTNKNSDAGMLAGKAVNATIENCNVYGTVTLKDMFINYTAGGLVGDATDTVIKNCSAYVTANIPSKNYGSFGGLVGNTKNCKISFCSTEITAGVAFTQSNQYFGGFIGKTSSQDEVYDCFAKGSLTVIIPNTANAIDFIYIGGMIGSNSCTVERCYSAVDITATCEATLNSRSMAGFCPADSGIIKDSLYCGKFRTDEKSARYSYAFTNRIEHNVYVLDGAIDFEFANIEKVTAEQLTEEFFKTTLNFGNGWVFEEGALPRFK